MTTRATLLRPTAAAPVGLAADDAQDGIDRVVARATVALADDDAYDDDPSTSTIVAWPSIYNHPYRMGAFTWHQIEPGAFADSIAEQDGRVPVYAQHGWSFFDRPPIGHTSTVEDAERDDGEQGMRIVAHLYRDVPDGLAVARCIEARALREWSIGYQILEYTVVEDDEDDRNVWHIERAALLEPSSVLRGANPLTSTEDPDVDPDTASQPTPEPAPDPDQLLAELADSSPSYRAALRRLTA